MAQAVYVFLFWQELVHLVQETPHLTEEKIMLVVLGLIDVVMISNLLIMVIVGGYETFVSRLGLAGHPDEPDWLSHVPALAGHHPYGLRAVRHRHRCYRQADGACGDRREPLESQATVSKSFYLSV